MAKIKLAYIGGGSTRAPGTMAAFINQAANFAGSHFVLVDINAEHLAIVHKLAVKMAREAGAEITISATTNRREALQGCDVILTSFRPAISNRATSTRAFPSNTVCSDRRRRDQAAFSWRCVRFTSSRASSRTLRTSAQTRS